jgi:hypothetical protein
MIDELIFTHLASKTRYETTLYYFCACNVAKLYMVQYRLGLELQQNRYKNTYKKRQVESQVIHS